MLTHVVLFQVKEPVAENIEAIVSRLRAMQGVVAGLESVTVGVDVNRGPRAYDVCLITTHADEAALTTYQADPKHGEVKAFIGGVLRGAAMVDFVSP